MYRKQDWEMIAGALFAESLYHYSIDLCGVKGPVRYVFVNGRIHSQWLPKSAAVKTAFMRGTSADVSVQNMLQPATSRVAVAQRQSIVGFFEVSTADWTGARARAFTGLGAPLLYVISYIATLCSFIQSS